MAAPSVTTKPLLLSCWYCPYVQRAWLALSAKKADYDSVDIDLMNKPGWFMTVSPHGKVPVITYKEEENGEPQVLYESLVLIQWVEEYYKSGPSLLPSSAAKSAAGRIAISRFDSKFVPAWYKLLRSGSAEEAKETSLAMEEELVWLEGQLDSEGPFYYGKEISLVDCAMLPWLLRGPLLKHFWGYDLCANHSRVAAYVEAARQHPAVLATIKPPEGKDWIGAMVEAYSAYVKK